ncbi:hypothetical protein GWC95_15790 [Sediminibacterium roseum]|uniref:Uncharacterized protein n=1 Tax=Sediminibacterium roseum TaxID=1978412 RepID=A0ABW9ZW66_9BACT|nr:hypothetical protein [Sediminibacterium roseum]NCI51391.1 hypothetical protein [Sediminibacterium roseum]
MNWKQKTRTDLEDRLQRLKQMQQKTQAISHLLPITFPAEILLLQQKIQQLIKRLS